MQQNTLALYYMLECNINLQTLGLGGTFYHGIMTNLDSYILLHFLRYDLTDTAGELENQMP